MSSFDKTPDQMQIVPLDAFPVFMSTDADVTDVAHSREYPTRDAAEILRLQSQVSELQTSLTEARALTEQVTTERDLYYNMAYVDELTGKPNRRALIKQLSSQIAEQPGKIGVVFVDLDNLKDVNDTRGHEAGDELIRLGMDVLVKNLRASQTDTSLLGDPRADSKSRDLTGRGAFRLSGDEEVGVIEGVTDVEQLDVITNRLQEAYDSQGVRASIGYTLHEPGQTAVEVISKADSAMSTVKNQRRKRTQELERAALPPHVLKRGLETVVEVDELGIGVDGLKRYFGTPGR